VNAIAADVEHDIDARNGSPMRDDNGREDGGQHDVSPNAIGA
jgi:hypothetical protein